MTVPPFSYGLEQVLHAAIALANVRHHERVTLEHLLFALLDDKEIAAVLCAESVDPGVLQERLSNYIDDESHGSDARQGASPTDRFQRVIQLALCRARDSEHDEVTNADVFRALFSESGSYAVRLLKGCHANIQNVVGRNDDELVKDKALGFHSFFGSMGVEQCDSENDQEGEDIIESCCIDLKGRARAVHIDPLIGRDAEMSRMVQILCRRRKNSPLLVGDPGVGKTALVWGLAYRIVQGIGPKILQNANIFQLDIGALLSGTRYRGDFEKRLRTTLGYIEKSLNAILFIDEIHTVIGAGMTSGSTVDIAGLLKPVLQRGSLRCIGATSYREYRRYCEGDPALARRFQEIDVREPSQSDTMRILKGIRSRFERFHRVRYTETALKAAVGLSSRYIHDRKLPDKAIDVIDEAGVLKALSPGAKPNKIVSRKDIEATVASIARVPPHSLSRDEVESLRCLGENLKNSVFGQDDAIEALVAAVQLSRAGLRNPEKPIGSYLFYGPTGVGKTEIARQISALLGLHFLRFDMSEYMERHAVSRLLGAPPGYVGSDRVGLLTDGVDRHPYSVLLLDEIEKAHPDIFNIFLQVMDYGKLTDSSGKQVDFRHVILIMTSNAGSSTLEGVAPGFVSRQRVADDDESAIRRLFPPEFRNRLDAVLRFGFLDSKIVRRIVEKFRVQLEEQLADRGIRLEWTSEAIEWLCRYGYDKCLGARPLERAIQEHIKKPLAEQMLFGALSGGGDVRIGRTGRDSEVDSLTLDVLSAGKEPFLIGGRSSRRQEERKEKESAGDAKRGYSVFPLVGELVD